VNTQPTMKRLTEPERALLLRLLAIGPAAEADAHPARPVDWSAVLDAVAVALGPLVARGIAQGRAGPEVPPEVTRRLQATTAMLAATHARRQAALRTVCHALADATIPTIVLKGAALAHLVYPDPILRPMRDLDLWVPSARLDDAVAALAPHGFRHPADHALRPEIIRSPEGRILETPEHRARVELHARLESLAGVAWARFETAWDASEPASLGGIAARVLCPEHLLTHLCLHLSRAHAFDLPLLHLLDIAHVTRRWAERWDWPCMVRDWREQRVAAWMLLGLALPRDLLGAHVPEDLEARVGVPADWSTMRALAKARLWAQRGQRLPGAAVEVLRQGSGANRLRWLRRRFFDHYWRPPEPRGALALVLGAGRRLWYDLRVKVPKYLVAWQRGALRGPGLEHGIALERDRAELERLVVAAGDLGYPTSPGATGPAGLSHAIAGPPPPR